MACRRFPIGRQKIMRFTGNKTVHRFFQKIHNLRYHYICKIFLSYILIFAAVFVGVIFFSGFQLAHKQIESDKYKYGKSLEQTVEYIRFNVNEVRGVVDTVTNSATVMKAMDAGQKYYMHSTGSWNIITSSGHRYILYNLFSSSNIKSIALYTRSGELSLENSMEYEALSEEGQDKISARIAEMTGTYYWIPAGLLYEKGSTRYVTYLRKLSQPSKLNSFIGYAAARVPEEVFQNILLQMQVTPNSIGILYNSEGEVISSIGLDERTNDGSVPSEISALEEEALLCSDGTLKNVRINGEDFLVGAKDIPGSDWTLTLAVPVADSTDQIISTITNLALWLLLSIVLSIPVIYLVSRSLSRRIISLKNEMMKFVRSEESDTAIEIRPYDEIDDLSQSFHLMKDNIERLMLEQYENGIARKNLEIQVLQAQINPHFLYNTLETLYWMGVQNDVPEVSRIAEQLGTFYRLSLSNGETYVPLSSEIRHVEAYTEIQNIRFGNKIHLIVDVPEEDMDIQMIHLTLQPLVENAIQHGIREKKTENGTIVIRTEREKRGEEEFLSLTIHDDGVGMTNDQLRNMLKKESRIEGHGYGVWNINERIRLNFGDRYCLRYTSRAGEGTTVEMILPVVRCTN